MTKYLLSGSFAYDTILLHEGELQQVILPESISRLNVSFGIDRVENEFGGTGGNIAYNASLLGQSPVIVGSLGGKDCETYLEKLASHKLESHTMTIIENEYCAHAWILTDKNNNQITSFNVGSMKHFPKLPLAYPEIWHLAPENPLTMAKLAMEGQKHNKKVFFDPGQMLPYFLNGASEKINSLENILIYATGLFVNEYEAELLSKHLKIDLQDLVKENNHFIIRTLGKNGVDLITAKGIEHIGVAHTDQVTDPTGCGDAFRAGFLYGYTHNLSLVDCVKIGSTMGSFAVEKSGGQNHNPSMKEIVDRLESSFNMKLSVQSKNSFKF